MFNLFRRRQTLLSSGVCADAVDRHSHILPGLDDGIKTIQESLQTLDHFVRLGFSDLWCTPHIMEEWPNETEMVKRSFDALCNEWKGSMKLHLGAEYMLDSLFESRLASDDLIVGDDGLLLVETYASDPSGNGLALIDKAMEKGYRILLAHPERYRYIDIPRIEYLHANGVKLQLNLPSVTGFYGEQARKKAEILLNKGLYTCFGSDCHGMKGIVTCYEERSIPKETVELLKSLKSKQNLSNYNF